MSRPDVSFESAIGVVGGIARVAGWTLDPDNPQAATYVDVYIDGWAGSGARRVNMGLANLARLDVARANPKAGPNHGFSATITGLTPGTHTLYVYAIDAAGPGANPLLRTLSITVPSPNPIGSFEGAQGIAGGFIGVRGWRLDPDAPTKSGQVHVYIDRPAGPGVPKVVLGAALSRPDVAAARPGAGKAHGFNTAIGGMTPGPHTLFLYAINIAGGGSNVYLGARAATVPANVAGSPIGNFDNAIGFAGGTARVAGWAFDPDNQTAASYVEVYIDGWADSGARRVDLGLATIARPDVARVYPTAGPNHGFISTITGLTPGTHTLYVYAVNATGAGVKPLLLARTITIPPAPVPSKVSLSIPPREWVGTMINASTKVTDQYGGAMAGRTVTLQKMQSDSGTWNTVTSLTTDSTGAASYSFANGLSGHYRWVTPAATGAPSLVSPSMMVTSTARVAERRPATSMTRGRYLKVSGSVSRVPSAVVYIQYRHPGGSWHNGARATVRGTAVSGKIKLRRSAYIRLYVRSATSYRGSFSRVYATLVR